MGNYVAGVALRKESVDRNYVISIARMVPRTSLSARRAWIEIWPVDRSGGLYSRRSLSARRAWIEISVTRSRSPMSAVALRKESVDRNYRSYL